MSGSEARVRQHDRPNDASAASAEIDPAVLRRSMIISATASAIGVCFFGVIVGGIFGRYVKDLGLSEWLPLALALFPIAQITQPLSSWVMERLRMRRAIFFFSGLIPRLLWLPIGAIGIWTEDQTVRLVLLITLVLGFGLLASPGMVAWLSWMSDLVPHELRGRYFGYRQTAIQVVIATFTTLAGYYLAVHDHGLIYFRNVYWLAVVFGLVDILMFAFVYHPPQHEQPDRPSLRVMISRSWASPGLRRLLLTLIPWHFAGLFMFPFILRYCYDVLHFSAFDFQIIVLVGTAFGMVFTHLFGQFIDAYGHRTTLILLLSIHFLLPLLYLFAGPESVAPIWLAFLIGSTVNPVVMNLKNTLLMIHSDRATQAMSFSIFSVFTGITLLIAPMAASAFGLLVFGREAMGDETSYEQAVVVFGWALHPFQIIIATAALFRFVAFLMALSLPPEDRKPPAGDVIRFMVATGPFRPFISLYRFARATASRKVFNGAYAERNPDARWRGTEMGDEDEARS